MTGHTAKSHSIIRAAQKANADAHHHPAEKIAQLEKYTDISVGTKVLEVFAGAGNLTNFYRSQGADLTSLSKVATGDSFDYIYRLRAEKKKYDFIDIDGYGYPDKFFPVIFELCKDTAHIVFTFPIVGVNALNGITEQHFITFWHSDRPSIGDVIGVLTDQAMREWFRLSLVDATKIKRIWRIIIKVQRVKATEMTNVRNRSQTNQ